MQNSNNFVCYRCLLRTLLAKLFIGILAAVMVCAASPSTWAATGQIYATPQHLVIEKDQVGIADIAPDGGDGVVNFLDLAVLIDSWLATPASPNWNPQCDIAPCPTRDEIVNFLDFAVLAKYWLTNTTPPVGTSTITWSTSGCQTAQVYVSVNGAAETLFSTSAGKSQDAPWIGVHNCYVFKLYEGTAHTILLAWTSVTSHLPPDSQFGFSYWPQGCYSDCLNDEDWPTMRPIVEEDLDHISSMSAGVLRLMIFPGNSGWTLSHPLSSDYYEQTTNIVDFLSLCADRDIQAYLVFANSLFECKAPNGDYWWMTYYGDTPEGFTLFLEDTKTWIDGFVNSIESSAYKTTVFAYDIGSEYKMGTPNRGWYTRFLLDESAIPLGKRHVSVLRIDEDQDLDDLAWQLEQDVPNGVKRRLDFVDFRIYPENYYLSMPVEEARDTCQAKFPHSTIFMGEYGVLCGDSSGESNQQDKELDVVEQVLDMDDDPQVEDLPFYVHWRLWDWPSASDYGWGYNEHSPKDVLGGTVELLNLVYNPDMKIVSGGKPSGWVGGGTINVNLLAGPGYSNAATNYYYGVLRANDSPGSVWISSSMTEVEGGKELYVNAYIRSDMENIGIDVNEYDANYAYIRSSHAPDFDPSGWSWNNYLRRVGTWSVTLTPNTRYVVVAVSAACDSDPSYLEVDAVSIWER